MLCTCPYTWKRSFIRTHAALHYWLLPDQATGRWAATPPCQVSCIRHYHFNPLAAMAAQVHQLVACCHRFLWSWCGGQVLTTCQHTECNVNTPHAQMCRQAQTSAAVDRSLALRRECHLCSALTYCVVLQTASSHLGSWLEPWMPTFAEGVSASTSC